MLFGICFKIMRFRALVQKDPSAALIAFGSHILKTTMPRWGINKAAAMFYLKLQGKER
jgi:hypothetical protein